MGRLYDACQHVMCEIDARGLDVYKARGAVTMETGFIISLVEENEPDDPEKIHAVREAARSLFGIEVPV